MSTFHLIMLQLIFSIKLFDLIQQELRRRTSGSWNIEEDPLAICLFWVVVILDFFLVSNWPFCWSVVMLSCWEREREIFLKCSLREVVIFLKYPSVEMLFVCKVLKFSFARSLNLSSGIGFLTKHCLHTWWFQGWGGSLHDKWAWRCKSNFQADSDMVYMFVLCCNICSSIHLTKKGFRSLGSGFEAPSAALQSFINVSVVIFIPIYDRVLVLVARVITAKPSGIEALQVKELGLAYYYLWFTWWLLL